MNTRRRFGPTRSLAAPSAATSKVAASGAANERLSPTGWRAGRVVRMGQERGVRGGLGRGGEPRRRFEVAGRAQAGGANTACVQGHCARARVGGALTFRLDLALLARRQREDEVDPEGLDVRGRGECPDPAARYPAGGLAQLARAPSPAPARSRTTILSLSRGQAANGHLTRRLTARARRRTPPGSAPASRKLVPFDLLSTRTAAACSCARARLLSTCLPEEKRRSTSEGKNVSKPYAAAERAVRPART